MTAEVITFASRDQREHDRQVKELQTLLGGPFTALDHCKRSLCYAADLIDKGDFRGAQCHVLMGLKWLEPYAEKEEVTAEDIEREEEARLRRLKRGRKAADSGARNKARREAVRIPGEVARHSDLISLGVPR
jgi:hypothetical protein